MEILVCIKQVPDDSVEIRLGADGQPDLSSADPQGNAFDTYAQELAVRFVEEHGGAVTVVSVGPEDNKTCLKNALAVGAAKAHHISDEGIEGADAAVTANLLAAGIKKIEETDGVTFDLIFCGRESTDAIGGEVGELLAEALGLPFVSDIVEAVPDAAGLKVKKELESGYLMVETPVPAVMTVSKPDYDPRYPTIKSKLAARKVKIPTIAKADTGISADAETPKVVFAGFEEPPKREAGVKIQEDEPADAVAKAFEIMTADKVL